MYKVLVFAGTTEGYEVSRFLAKHKVHVYVCTATDYGKKSLEETEYLKVSPGRLDEEKMEELFLEIEPELVLDATHPYAAEVTANIREACEQTGFPYFRVLREEGSHEERAVYVDSPEAAAEYLKETQGNVLLTTGSKELGKFTVIPDFQNRLFARVLSLPSVVKECSELGVEGKHLIGMQGPFSKDLNIAMLRQFDCRYLVTKDTGKAGGFQEKIEAALEYGAIPVIIGRPLKEEGMSLAEAKAFLAERFCMEGKPETETKPDMKGKTETERKPEMDRNHRITLLGIGMGSEGSLTVEGKRAAEQADLIIGAKRMLRAVAEPGQETLCEYRSEEIAKYIKEHPEYSRIVIALSGDVGFCSGAKKLLELLGSDVEILCGISSVNYFMAKIGISWDDAKILSAHGRKCNLIHYIKHNRKVFSILGASDSVAELAKKLVYYGMGEVLLYVGERLSYKDEKIFVKKASELTQYQGDALSVVCVYNENAVQHPGTHGIADEEFIRGKAPMTKEEVRTVSLSKLCLKEDSVCYDVGAGTGSVSVEMAVRAHQGEVFAIEKKDEAVELLRGNKRKFAADNLTVVPGTAPDALADLPAPTHAFIGGSSGNLKEIVKTLLQKNEKVKIVINCITLETVSEVLETAKEFVFETQEIVQLGAARSKSVGRYHMMMGENPIYIITLQNPGKEKV